MDKLKQKQLNTYKSVIKKEQDDVVLSYMPALRALAFRLKERLPASIDVNDLISIGVEEMIKLSRKYDKSQNDSFWSYAKKRIYGGILDFLRSLDVMSRANRQLMRRINAAIDEYFSKFEEEPDDEYLASALNESVEKIKDARCASQISCLLPLDEGLGLVSEQDTDELVHKQRMLESVQEILEKLDQREQLIIQLYYYEELNLKEISEILNITQSRICQIQKRVLQQIRASLEG